MIVDDVARRMRYDGSSARACVRLFTTPLLHARCCAVARDGDQDIHYL